MTTTSTPTAYGSVAIAIHWVSALAVLVMLGSGLALENAGEAAGWGLLRLHAITGTLLLVLTLARIAWFWFADKRPLPPASSPAWQRRVAATVHVALYVVIIVLASSGIATLVLSGALSGLAGGVAPLPDFDGLAPRIGHGLAFRLLLALLVMHVGAALYHQFVMRDRLLARMGLGRRPA